MIKFVWGYLQVLQHLKKEKKLTNEEHDFFLQTSMNFQKKLSHLRCIYHFFVIFNVLLSHFSTLQRFIFKKIIQGF